MENNSQIMWPSFEISTTQILDLNSFICALEEK